jgi:hypothetical protein
MFKVKFVAVNMAVILDSVHRLQFFQHNISETEPVFVIICKVGWVPIQLGPLERAALSYSKEIKMPTTIENAQNNSHVYCHIPSPETFRIRYNLQVSVWPIFYVMYLLRRFLEHS